MPHYIPPHIVDSILVQADILEVVQTYIPELKKKGTNYWACSPFANEKTPSFSVNPAKGIFKCFSSGIGGNVVKFLQEMEGMTWIEAMHHLAKRYGIETNTALSDADRAALNRKESLLALSTFAADWYHKQLTETKEGETIQEKLLEERGIDLQAINDFQLGFAPSTWTNLCDIAKRRGMGDLDLLEAGLASRSKRGTLIDRFRNRLIFPIKDVYGNVIGFGGRDLSGDKEAPKYLNSPETPLYHKSSVLFNIDKARKEIQKTDLCILTEGYTDVISPWTEANVKNIVATCGTACTADHAKLIKRFTHNVLILYDGDEAGLKAASRAIDVLVGEGMHVEVCSLPEGKDPDDVIRDQGGKAFSSFIHLAENRTGWIGYKLKYLQTILKAQKPANKAAIVDELLQVVRKVDHPILRDEYCQEIAKATGVNIKSIQAQLKEKPLALKREISWEEYKTLCRKLGLAPSDDFSRSETGGVEIEYHTLSGELLQKKKGDDKVAISRITTHFESPYAVYIPAAFRRDELDPHELEGFLYLVEDEITANLFAMLGLAAMGLGRRDAFRNGKTSSKACSELKQLIKAGWDRIVYVPSGEAFQLPSSKKGYKEINAGSIAMAYADTLTLLQKALPKQRIWCLLPDHKTEKFNSRATRWMESILLAGETDIAQQIDDAILHERPNGLFTAHEITNSTHAIHQSIFKVYSSQAFFEFHGIEKLGQVFKLGKKTYELDLSTQKVNIKDEGFEPNIKELYKVYCSKGRDGGWKPITNFTMNCEMKIMGKGAFGIYKIMNSGTEQTRTVLITNEEFREATKFALRVSEIPNLNAYSKAGSLHLAELHQLVCEGEPEASNFDRLMGYHTLDDEYDLIADQEPGMWVFGNGVLTQDGIFHEIDELGFVTLTDKKYFLPALSPIKRDARRHRKQYEWQRKFTFKVSDYPLEKWIEAMRYVYLDNAHKGIAFAIMAIYYDIILELQGEVPLLHVLGEPQGGKSKFIDSLSVLWSDGKLKVMDLQARRITEAAYAAHFEQYSNCLNIVNEVNPSSISEDRIYPLKSLYEGKLGEKMAGPHTTEMYSGLATSASVLIGQEAITHMRAIAERCIPIRIEKRTYTPKQRAAFNRLKNEIERQGLGQVFIQLGLHRSLIEEHFTARFEATQQAISERLSNPTESSERFIRNWSTMLSPLLILMQEGMINYPASVDWLLSFASEEIMQQEKNMVQRGLLGIFFYDFIEPYYLDRQYGLNHNHVFHDPDTTSWQDKKSGNRFDTPQGTINIQTTHAYARFGSFLSHRKLKLENSSIGDLRRQLKAHPAFLGESPSEWLGFKLDEKGNIRVNYNGTSSKPNADKKRSSAYVFDAARLKLNIRFDFGFERVFDDDPIVEKDFY